MSLDKFGRFVSVSKINSRVKHVRKYPDFTLTPEGNISAGGKRIRYVSDPIDSQDCVTKIYMTKFMQHVDNRLSNVREQMNSEMSDINKSVESKISEIESRIHRILEDVEAQKVAINNIVQIFDKTIKNIDITV